MGNKSKSWGSKKGSYKLKAKNMNEKKRKKKLGNDDPDDNMSNAKRSRNEYDETTASSFNCEVASYLKLEQVIPQNVQHENPTTKDTHFSVEVENSTPEKKIDVGRRIINVSHFMKKLVEISNHGPLDCGLSCIELVGEKLNGLASKFTFLCKMCNKRFIINSDGNNCLDINTSAVAATISIGCGHSQMLEFTSAMNLPIMSQKTYQKKHKLLSDNWQQLAQDSMAQAAEEERNLAIAEGRLTKDGTPIIDVVADGVYGKRSYKKNYSALSGAAAIIGRKTGKILYLGVGNKYCFNCDRAEKKNTTPPEHFCSKNYSGPSTGMESQIIVEGFKQSLSTHGLIYGRLISDGDSSTYSKILQARPYPNITVEKVECRNHLLRNFCNKLQSLQTEVKYLKEHRKLLTTKRILTIRSCIKKAIKYNKNRSNPEEQFLFDDILQAHHHAFGNHLSCKAYFCDKTGKLEREEISKDFELSSLWQRICLIVQNIAGHARSLLHDVDSNVVERYHSVIAKYVGGKRVNYSLKNSYQTRCTAAAVSFNEKNALSKLHKKITHASPRGKLKMWEDRKYKKNVVNKRYTKKKRRLIFTKTSDKDYGEACEKPDLPEDVLNSMTNIFLENLKKTDDERATIERKTILQRANGEWLEMRRSLLTASNFGRVIKRRKSTPCANLVKDILYQKKLDNVESISHGQKNEKTALAQLAVQEKITIRPCGLFIDKDISFLGATPDGLTGEDTIVEVKCPLTANKMGLAVAIDKKKVTFWKKTKEEELVINKKHCWYYQIQGQLHVTQKRYCLFAVWENEKVKLKIEKIERDDIFWEKEMKAKLITFYIDCLLPEILDPRLARNMKIREPYIEDKNIDQDKREDENQNERKTSENKNDENAEEEIKDIENCEQQSSTHTRYVDFSLF